MRRQTAIAVLCALLSAPIFAQSKPAPQGARVPPDQEYALMKERYHNLKRATKNRSATWTPMIGGASASANGGGKINALEFMSLNESLIFANGEDQAQVAKAIEIFGRQGGKAKIIIVGKVSSQTTGLPQGKTYHDLKGKLAKRLGLQHGPVLVVQDSKQLRIEEIAP